MIRWRKLFPQRKSIHPECLESRRTSTLLFVLNIRKLLALKTSKVQYIYYKTFFKGRVKWKEKEKKIHKHLLFYLKFITRKLRSKCSNALIIMITSLPLFVRIEPTTWKGLQTEMKNTTSNNGLPFLPWWPLI